MCQSGIAHPTLNNTPALVLKGHYSPTPGPGKWPVCLGTEMKSPARPLWASGGFWTIGPSVPLQRLDSLDAPTPRLPIQGPCLAPVKGGGVRPTPTTGPRRFGLSALPSHFLQAQLLPQSSQRDALGQKESPTRKQKPTPISGMQLPRC